MDATYCEETRYYQYLIENAIESEKVNGFLKVIGAVQENSSYTKLYSIHEDVGDKIRSLWDKFIAFVNRVWAKFTDFAQRMINSDKGYLEQYKDTILNTKPNDTDIEMRDYSAGIHRMTSASIPPFSTVEDKIPVDDADISFKSMLIPDYKDANQEFSSFSVAYFQGGEDKKSMNLMNLNMTDLYNFCHDFDKIKTIIEKDKNTLTSTITSIQGNIEKAKNSAQQQDQQAKQQADQQAQQQQQNQANTNGQPRNQNQGNNQQQNQTNTNGQPRNQNNGNNRQQVNASYSLDNYIGSYFTEDDGGLTIGKPNQNTNTTQNSAVTSGSTSKPSANMRSVQTNPAPNANEPAEGIDLDSLTKKVANYNTASSSVLTAKMTSAHIIYRDYMKLIKLHVGAQVGANGDTQVAKAGSNYQNAMKIDNPQQVLNTINQIENTKDANQKSKLTSDLNAQIKGANPNFGGGIDVIKQAAQNALKK